ALPQEAVRGGARRGRQGEALRHEGAAALVPRGGDPHRRGRRRWRQEAREARARARAQVRRDGRRRGGEARVRMRRRGALGAPLLAWCALATASSCSAWSARAEAHQVGLSRGDYGYAGRELRAEITF